MRGFRIELGEIEAALAQHPSVQQVVVVAREDQPDSKQLVAYLVVERESAPAYGEWRNYLKEKLPEYMVPAAFVVLDEMPLTANVSATPPSSQAKRHCSAWSRRAIAA